MIDNKFQTFTSYIKGLELTPNEEDYIEMIYRMSLNHIEKIKVNELAKLLNITPPSVTKMIKKLSKKNLIYYERYGNINLTPLGINIGEKLIFRHDTLEKFLSLIGQKENLLEKTEKIEHVIDEDTLLSINKLVKFLEDSKYTY